MAEVHAGRRQQAWAQLTRQVPDASALVVTSLVNIRYLTGFAGSNAFLLLGPQDAVLGTDQRYETQARDATSDIRVLLDRQTLPAVVDAWWGGGDLAVEAEHLSVSGLRGIESRVSGRVVETVGVVEACRVVKDSEEIASIQRACQISDDALLAVLPQVSIGMTEREIARRLEGEMLARGADGLSFATIVAGGPHSAIPHHRPTERPLAPGELLLIDFGAEVDGYHADQTRTFVLGEPADWQREVHAVVAAAQAAGCEAARAGTHSDAVDAVARSIIVEAGMGDRFTHGLGHGVGLEIHEAPFVGPRSTGRLPAGSPVTIEPGVYLPDRGGVRIEDTIVVDEGPSRSLTTLPRDLVVLG